MPESVSNIKDKVIHYKELIQRKEDLNKEYQSWISLYQEMAGVLRNVRAVYEVERTPEAKAELDVWLQEEKDYLEIINEYTEKFQEINEELSVFDANTLEAQADYLANLTKFQELSNRMKEIEKHSKKMVGKPEAVFVAVANAEGRDKKIIDSLATDYAKLAEEKRYLSKIIKKQYNTIINNISEPESSIEETITMPVVDDYSEFDFENLSKEDKIKELEARMERMTKASGRKQRIKYKGEMIELPRVYVGQYLVCGSEIARLRKQIEEEQIEEEIAFNARIERELFSEVKQQPKEPIDAEYVTLPSDEELLEKISTPEERCFDLETTSLFKLVNASYEKTKKAFDVKKEEKKTAAKSKPKGFMKILNIKKPRFKKKIKEMVKKAGCVIVAGVMIAVCAIPAISGLIKNNNKNKDDIPDFTTPPSVSGEAFETQGDNNEIDYTINDTESTNTQEEEQQIMVESELEAIKHTFKLGEEILINEGARVHNNMYDATLNRNGLKPYFGNEVAKTVGGVAVNYEGQLYFFYANDVTSQENVDKLLANGGEIASILAMNAHGYEGFYNISDVQSLSQSIGGMNR